MKKRRIYFLVPLLILILVSGFFYAERGTKTGAIRTTGIVEGIEVNLSTKVPGRISEMCCKEGDEVKQGQIVFELDSEDLRASVEQARARVRMAQEQVKSAEAAIESSSANIASVEADIKTA